VQVVDAPGASVVGVVGTHTADNPGGKGPATHVTPVAVTAGAAPFEHV
jgi:hypothetical protein